MGSPGPQRPAPLRRAVGRASRKEISYGRGRPGASAVYLARARSFFLGRRALPAADGYGEQFSAREDSLARSTSNPAGQNPSRAGRDSPPPGGGGGQDGDV